MSEWKEYKLGELTEVVTKGTTPTTIGRGFIDKGVNFIKSEAVGHDGRIDKATFVFIEEETHKKLKRSQLQKDDILFSMAGVFLGKNAMVTEDMLPANTNQALAIIRLNKQKSLPKYIHYYLRQKSVVDFVNNMSGQSAQPNINFEEIKSIDILLPPVSEQAAITEVLSSLDDKIDLLHRQNITLEQLAETLFRQWFAEEAEEGWKETTLDQHTEVFRGISYKGSGLTENGLGLPMHNLNSVHEGGGYKYEGIKFYNGEYKERHLVSPGDIIVANTEQGHEHRLIGFPGIVPDSFGEIGLFSQHIYKLMPLKETILSREFIYHLLKTPIVREQIVSATNGSTVNMLAIDGLQRPVFKLPPKEKISMFTNIVSNYWDKRNSNIKQISILTELRDALLPKLMSGEVKLN